MVLVLIIYYDAEVTNQNYSNLKKKVIIMVAYIKFSTYKYKSVLNAFF